MRRDDAWLLDICAALMTRCEIIITPPLDFGQFKRNPLIR